MQFRSTVIWKDIQKILDDTTNYYPIGGWSMAVHTVKLSFPPLRVLNVDIDKDFMESYTETVMVTAMMDRATYLNHLYPYLDNLEVTLYRYPTQDLPANSKVKPDFQQRFKAIFLPNDNHNPLGTKDEMNAAVASQLLEPVFLHLQLMNLNVEPMRLKFISTSLLGYTNEMNLSAIIKNELSKITLPTGKVIDKIDIVKPDNSAPVQNLVVPSDTNILDFPTFLQHKGMGVYNSGIGTFVTSVKDIATNKYQSHFYVYPTHKTVKKNRPSMHLYNLPDFELAFNDRTFSIKGSAIHLMGHINQGYRENRQTDELNNGVGFRMAHASPYMSKPVKMTPSGPEGESKKLNFKVAATSRPDGFNLANRSGKTTSANPYIQYSDHIKNVGNYIFFKCYQLDQTLLAPSMPVTLYRLVGNSTVTQQCTLVGFKHIIQMEGKGMLSRSGYTEVTILKLFHTGKLV